MVASMSGGFLFYRREEVLACPEALMVEMSNQLGRDPLKWLFSNCMVNDIPIQLHGFKSFHVDASRIKKMGAVSTAMHLTYLTAIHYPGKT